MSRSRVRISREQRKKQIVQHTVIGGAVILGLIVLVVILSMAIFNKNEIVFSIEDGETVTCEVGGDGPGDVTARYRGTLIHKSGTEIPVTTDGEVDCKKVGTYKISYTASHNDITKTIKRTVIVEDKEPPTIKLVSDPKHKTPKGQAYQEEGYSAADNCDGDLTDKVTKEQKDDVITYTVTDSSGNTATAKREIVYGESVIPKDKVVYLTYDDGPGQYTQKLLDVLDKYNAKVTFFVTNQYPGYQNMIKEERKRGHTVAIHSYSHDYKHIYSSKKNFMDDIEKMGAIIQKQTGEKPFLIRFPGGSSNTISAHYCKGIMTELTKELEKAGYQYADWNVASGDAGETTSTKKVISNIENGLKSHKVSVVLQHDIKEFSVNAVESVLKWGKKNGYTFLAMTPDSEKAHHGINN